ncbi:hypothetical protein HELRODRAFT_175491 [Helobdella robusta]|uniref:Glycosyltransferase family 92 protein n=1 Tax=Helobdella robusta TaxID=6412 RepID=T1F9B7_HELRO|nr:hypothetical protein HELRODRAFT_175491 [Helobdella robusta]ESO00534.1 hypothetical protein HELRODRAFT_175491 [Helobdella robusta]
MISISYYAVNDDLEDGIFNHFLKHFVRKPISGPPDKDQLPLSNYTRKFIVGDVINCERVTAPDAKSVRHFGRRWQVENSSSQLVFYYYNAFLDDRAIVGKHYLIRVLALNSLKGVVKMYCHIWVEFFDVPITESATVEDTVGGVYEFDSTKYRLQTISCKYSRLGGIPSFVSLTLGNSCKNSTNYIQIVRLPNKTRHDFGVCSFVPYRDIDSNDLIEWFEFHKIIGVTDFTVFIPDTDYNAFSDFVTPYYNHHHFISIKVLTSPFENMTSLSPSSFHQNITALYKSLSRIECLIRNMYRYKHIILLAPNDFFVPKNSYPSVSKIMQTIHSYSSPNFVVETYSLVRQYFIVDYTDTDNFNSSITNSSTADRSNINLKTIQSRFFVDLNSELPSRTVIIRPSVCLEIHDERCSHSIKHLNTESTFWISDYFATVQRYEKCDISTPNNVRSSFCRRFFENNLALHLHEDESFEIVGGTKFISAVRNVKVSNESAAHIDQH